MYKIGGLDNPDEVKTVEINGIHYVTNMKFTGMLRDNLIEWGVFLENYDSHDNQIVDQIFKILNIKEQEGLSSIIVPLLEKVYKLPAEFHMTAMIKQFVIYEPLAQAIYYLFTVIKNHYEMIIEKFIMTRNKYITENNLSDPLNDFDALIKKWSDINDQFGLDTSSLSLLFINPPDGLEHMVHIDVQNEPAIDELKTAIESFHYEGFCPKVPHQRLAALLKFPIQAFIKAIQVMNPKESFPDYSKIDKDISDILRNVPKKPSIPDLIQRETPPTGISEKELITWYMEHILDLRKQLLPYATQYEDYYRDMSIAITKITDDIVKKAFEDKI